jgi:hypothetical protein
MNRGCRAEAERSLARLTSALTAALLLSVPRPLVAQNRAVDTAPASVKFATKECPKSTLQRLPPIDSEPENPFRLTSRATGSHLRPATNLYGVRQGYGLPNLPAVCDARPTHALYGIVSYDSFRGVSDDSWQNNGIVTGFNYGSRLGTLSDLTGIGFQGGATIGVFDWVGTDYRTRNTDVAETQGFFTYGFFRKANQISNWSGALVQDWMLNSNFGVFGQNPTLSQLRGQIAYATSARNEFGLWGACRVAGDIRDVPNFGQRAWRPVDQLNVFWHYKWSLDGADTMIWVGVPEHDRMSKQGSLGDYLAGAQAIVPLSDRVSVYTLATYMHPSSRPGPSGAVDEAWNFTIGLWFYPGRNARSKTVAGQCWLPLVPVANNGYFLVDTNRTYQ